MADASAENSEDRKKKKKNILEEKSKEELVNLVKKYLNLLQKAKDKSDDLSEKCSTFEKEKNAAIQEHQSTEKELLIKIADLQQCISELNMEKVRFSEREQEILELKSKLKEASAEIPRAPSLRENEEQLQCLNMQLQSLKASCQCIQEENMKLQALNKEFLHENTLLKDEKKAMSLDLEKEKKKYISIFNDNTEIEARYKKCSEENENFIKQAEALKELYNENELLKIEKNDMLLNLETKHEEFNFILNEKNKIEASFESCIAENESYVKEIEALKVDIQKSNDDDICVFIKDIEDLRKENVDYLRQIEDLKGSVLKRNKNDDISVFIKDIEDLQKENKTLKIEIAALEVNQQKLTNTDSKENMSNIRNQNEQNTVFELQTCKETIEMLEGEVNRCQTEKIELLKEIKNLGSFSQLSDYKTGIEHALLQGASTESLMLPSEELNSNVVKQEPNAANVKKIEYVPQLRDANIFSPEDATGLDFALLQSGDISGFMMANDEPANSLSSPGGSFLSQTSVQNDELMEQYEMESLKQKLREYSSLCSDTLDENAKLKQELEYIKSKELVDEGVNTVLEDMEDEIPDISQSNKIGDVCGNAIGEKSDLSEKYVHLFNGILNMFKRVSLKEIGEQEQQNQVPEDDPMQLLRTLETIHVNKVDDLEKKLKDFNLQLELVVIGIKQGVRQKNSAMSDHAENKLEENMSLLKVLLDDLVVRSNNYASKIRNLESEIMSEKKKIEDEFSQLKELNQFLEVENRELNIEVKKLKQCFSDDAENCNNQEYYEEENYQRSPELYSIDESSELDEKTDSNANVADGNTLDVNTTSTDTCDFTIKTINTSNDCAIQVELDLYEDTSEVMSKIDEKDAKIEDNLLVIEQLRKENESLKEVVREKSILVEKIHSQLDFHLAKVEELAVELQEKEDDLKLSKDLNADLKKIQTEVENIKKQQANALKVAQDSVLELKIKNDNLNGDIKSFGLSFKEFIDHVNDNVMNIIKQTCASLEHYMEKCNHKEHNFSKIKGWISELNDDFKAYFDFLDHVNFGAMSDSSEFGIALQAPEDFSLFKVCDQDTCCLVSKDIELLNVLKFKIFSKFRDHLKSNFVFLIKDLDTYKTDIVPRMEKNIAELEQKLSEYACEKSSKEVQSAAENEVNEESVELLKTQLAEAETKMSKFKQIALKMKKELSQIKEQHAEVFSDKERLQKQNEKLLEELNKISGEQCKYVQNYQSVQNEIDKLQDECEGYQVSIKKLEEDLAAKLLEFAASNEQIMELESQLKSSKESLESSSSTKRELEVNYAELESKVIILESKINDKAEKINLLELNVAKHLKDLNAAWNENKNLKDQLGLAQKEGKKKNLLDLEMADYEKSISGLKIQIQKKDDEISELQSELKCMKEKYDCLLEEMRSTEEIKEIEFKRAESLKDVLDKTKIEFNLAKEHEAELISKTASLEFQLETLIREKEENKLHLSQTSVQIQHLQDVVKTSSDNHQRIVKSFELKISNQKQEILIAHKEVESVKQEFENYKIRVHSVLKQQKTVTPAITTIDADLKEKLETMNEKLKLQVKDLSEKLTAMNLEHETLHEEHEVLLQRYNKVVDEQEEKDKEWRQRLDEVNAEKNRLCTNQEELSSQHLLQNEMLVATYKKQIKIMSEEHKRIVSDLQRQLDAADIEIARLQRDQQKQQGLPLTPLPHDNSPFDIMSQERQEGEGSESTDEIATPIRHLSLATIPTSGFLPFEKLIQSPLEPGTPASFLSGHDSEKLTTGLNTANKKIEHLSELLNESESTNLRLGEQVRVLKDEVRRIENNKEREQHAENLEYLKNVFIKFASLQPGSEKAMLIPVLTTMLKLSPNEQQQLKSVAGDLDTDESSSAGWSSYLHRWSGYS